MLPIISFELWERTRIYFFETLPFLIEVNVLTKCFPLYYNRYLIWYWYKSFLGISNTKQKAKQIAARLMIEEFCVIGTEKLNELKSSYHKDIFSYKVFQLYLILCIIKCLMVYIFLELWKK